MHALFERILADIKQVSEKGSVAILFNLFTYSTVAQICTLEEW